MRPLTDHGSGLKLVSFLACAVTAVLSIVFLVGIHPANALPEYAALTGESCSVCHINPGGGGPRTLRGLLWAGRGKPVRLPPLPPVLMAPDVQDAYELYGIACAGCHGAKGEGASAMGLLGTGISATATQSYLLKGIPALGMPAFKGQLTDAQVDRLLNFVTELGSGKAPPLPDSYPLVPALLNGKPVNSQLESQGN